MRARVLVSLTPVFLFGVVLGCFDPETGSDDEVDCPESTLDCPCTPGGGCDPGLSCMSGTCVAEGGDTGESGTTTGDGDTGTSEDTSTDTSTDTTTDTTTTDSSSETGPGDLPPGAACTSDGECMSLNCYVVPFLGGQCGECNEDADCPDGGCTAPNPFENNGSFCNMGEVGGGCESNAVCMEGLSCGNVLDLLGLIQIDTCGECNSDMECGFNSLCAPIVDVMEFNGVNQCIEPNSLPQDAFCDLEGNGDMACQSGICSTIDIMGLAEVGACGQCNTDSDCMGTCVAGVFDLENGTLTGSTCQ